MVDLDAVKMRLSHKDLLLLIGILVAVIITVTTLVYQETSAITKQSSGQQKSSLNIIPKVIAKTLSSHKVIRPVAQ